MGTTNWSSHKSKRLSSSGGKAHQRADTEDRSAKYRRWHRTLDRKYYASDVDLIEWRSRRGEIVPVATTELTQCGNETLSQSYFDAILERYQSRDLQAYMAREVAAALGVDCFIVVFRENLSEFFVYNLSKERGWWTLSVSRYNKWLESLGSAELP